MKIRLPQLAKGGVIKEGIHAELDELRNIASGGKEYLVELQQKEAAATGISSLKIGFNNVFGYYLEVTNCIKAKCPQLGCANKRLPMQNDILRRN